MRPQPGNALQEGCEKKGDSDTDLRSEISVLRLLLRLRVLALGGPGGSGPWASWGLSRGESRGGLRPGGSWR